MKFTKMHGCGNDYIYINCFEETIRDPSKMALRLSDRHYGIGGDGLILIEPSKAADAYMHMFNRDGSEGMMCGNGIRCTAKYIYDHGLVPAERENVLIETGSGLKRIFLYKESGKVSMAKVDMGAVVSGTAAEVITVAGMELKMTREDVGNPHAVFFIEDNPCLRVNGYMTTDSIDSLSLFLIGPRIENHEAFQGRVNAEFAEVISRREVRMRVWERGSGETMACGTGAVAVAAAGYISGKLDTEVKVHLNGGDLDISYDPDSGHWYMTGTAEEVFEGTITGEPHETERPE